MISKTIKPIQCSVYFRVAEACELKFVSQFVVIGLGFFLGVDVGFEQIHQYVEYIFVHVWSCSFPFLVPQSV